MQDVGGVGGIIKGNDGEWLDGFAKCIGKCCTYITEIWRVYEGLKYARKMKFQALKMNVDRMGMRVRLAGHW
jgi:hypothetical protein